MSSSIIRESKLAMVGDVLFQGSVGRWDFPRGNQQQLIDSITEQLWPMGDDTAFVPGHGPMSTFGHERRDQSVRRRRALRPSGLAVPAAQSDRPDAPAPTSRKTVARSSRYIRQRGKVRRRPCRSPCAIRARMNDRGDRAEAEPVRRRTAPSPPSRIRNKGAFSMKLACARMRRSTGSLPPSPTLTLIARGSCRRCAQPSQILTNDRGGGRQQRDRHRCHGMPSRRHARTGRAPCNSGANAL